MGKKMSLASFLKPRDNIKPSWPWPSCKQPPQTLSFRASHDMYKTVNSSSLEPAVPEEVDSPFSFFTNSSDCPSFSTESEESNAAPESVEAVLQGLRSDRLFFEPVGESKCIVEEEEALKVVDEAPYKECVVLAMESEDPYQDFRSSMEDMVEAHGLKDWECLEELLLWYLRMNGKKTHRYIAAAFVDLLVEIVANNLEKKSEDNVSDCAFDQEEESFDAR